MRHAAGLDRRTALTLLSPIAVMVDPTLFAWARLHDE
jgi:hypothetical protein